jgi:hypothetical protein
MVAASVIVKIRNHFADGKVMEAELNTGDAL